MFVDAKQGSGSDSALSEDDLYDGIDPDDPMAAYLIQQKKDERALLIANGSYKKKSSSSRRKGESKEERRARKVERRRRKLDKEAKESFKRPSGRSRSRSPERKKQRDDYEDGASTRNGLQREEDDLIDRDEFQQRQQGGRQYDKRENSRRLRVDEDEIDRVKWRLEARDRDERDPKRSDDSKKAERDVYSERHSRR